MAKATNAVRAWSTIILLACAAGPITSWTDTADAAGVAVDAATPKQKKAAQGLYDKGMTHMQGKRYDKALEAFRESYNTVASPNSHLMIARCLKEAGRNLEAYNEYDAVATEAQTSEKYQDTLQAARTEMGEVKGKIGVITIRVLGATPDVKVTLGDKPLDPAQIGKPLPVEPGTVVVVATRPGQPEVRKTETVAAGASPTIDLDLAPPPAATTAAPPPTDNTVKVEPSKAGLRTWAYVAGGVGAAGLITFGVFGLMNNSKYNDLDSSCTNGHCPPSRSDDIDTGKKYQTIANIGLAVGIVGLGTGTVLYLVSGKKNKEQASYTHRPVVMVGPASLTVAGQF